MVVPGQGKPVLLDARVAERAIEASLAGDQAQAHPELGVLRELPDGQLGNRLLRSRLVAAVFHHRSLPLYRGPGGAGGD